MPIPQQDPNAAPAPQSSTLDQYMQTYGARLQSMLAGNDPSQPDPNNPDVPSGQNLGPDTYQANPQPFQQPAGPPNQSALAGGGPPSPGAAPAPGKGAPPQGGADAQGGGGNSFRDLWAKQTADQRKQYIDKLQTHLDATNQTINSAYDKMMQQLGGRPSTDISRSEKGMLLMEFGLHMMANSRGQQQGGGGGMGTNLAANIGASGTETAGQYQQLRSSKLAQQQAYDKMQAGLSQAHGRDVVNLASRSALEEGRDVRAAGAQDASIARVDEQQTGAAQRNDSRIAAAAARTDVTEAGKNKRAAMGSGQVTHTVTSDDGNTYGLTRSGQMIPLKDQQGNQIKAAPGGAGGQKQTAAQANFGLYVSTFGKDKDGNPLQGADLQKVQQDALAYAGNPRAAQLSDPQMRQMAEKTANDQIRANPLAWAGKSAEEISSSQAQIAEDSYQRLKRGGTMPGPTAGSSMTPPSRSALDRPANTPGSTPTQPLPGKPAPNGQQLQLLQQKPETAPLFFRKFGYLPPEFQKYLNQQPKSALAN